MDELDIELGDRVEDKISGFEGIVTTIGDHFVGCTRIGVRPINNPSRGSEEFFYGAQLTTVDDSTDKFADDRADAVTSCEFELGERVRDDVTGLEGIIKVINYSLWNCPQALVQPRKDGVSDEKPDSEWFDVPTLTSVGGTEFVGEYEDLADSEMVAQSGSVEDTATENLSADRL